MSALTIPNTFTAGSTIVAAQFNSNFQAVANVVNGLLDQTNFDTLTGLVSWAITTNELAIDISSTSTSGLVGISGTGVLTSGNNLLKITSAVAQTTGNAGAYLEFTSSSSSIPLLKLSNAGVGSGLLVVQSGVLASGEAAIEVDVSGVQTTGLGAISARLSNASSTIPLYAGKQAGSGKLIHIEDDSGNTLFEVANDGSIAGGETRANALINGNFDLWQRGTSTTIGNGSSSYLADRWYAKNSLGTSGVLTYSQVAGVSDGALFGASLQISTAPTASQANGCELYQVLENPDSLLFYNKTASFGVRLLALGNVSQVGIQFFYKTSEGALDTAIGSEVNVSVNSSTFTLGSIAGQALGTAQTVSGVVGVRIRIKAVSAGNTYDLNNGFVVEQAIMNQGSSAAAFKRAGDSINEELVRAQRFYEKSYQLTVDPGTSGTSLDMGATIGGSKDSAGGISMIVVGPYLVRKRVYNPSLTVYDSAGTSGVVSVIDTDGATFHNAIGGGFSSSERNVVAQVSASGASMALFFHWTADAEIY